MPLYEYRCTPCGQDFTVLRPMRSIEDLPTCPTCGEAEVVRKPSVFAVFRQGAGEVIPLSSSSGGCACGSACACSGHHA